MLTNAKIIGENISYAEYSKQSVPRGHKDFAMSRSELIAFAKCPAKWIAGANNDEQTDATVWGSLIDCLVLQPDMFDDLFAVCPETYEDEKTGKEKPWTFAANVCKEWKHEQGNKTCIKSDVYNAALSAIKTLHSDPIITKTLSHSRKQVMVTATYEFDGFSIPIRGLIDMVPEKLDGLIDLKTARDASKDNWEKEIFDLGYHVQAALFLDLYNAATNELRSTFYHIVQENVDPFVTTKYLISQEFLDIGRAYYRSALMLYALCLKSNHWPSYDGLCDSANVFDGWAIVEPKPYMVK